MEAPTWIAGVENSQKIPFTIELHLHVLKTILISYMIWFLVGTDLEACHPLRRCVFLSKSWRYEWLHDSVQCAAIQIDLTDVSVSWQEEDPGWYSRVPEFNSEPIVDIQMHVSHTTDCIPSLNIQNSSWSLIILFLSFISPFLFSSEQI